MKKILGVICGICLFFGLLNNVWAVSVGDNAGATRIFNFFPDGLSSFDDWDSSNPGLEVLNIDINFTPGAVGPSGLVPVTSTTRIKIYSTSGTILRETPWVAFTTNDLYDPATGELNCWGGPPSVPTAPCVTPHGDSEEDGWFFSGGLATYSGSNYMVFGVGFRAWSSASINGTTNHNLFRIWVFDATTGAAVKRFEFIDTSSGEFLEDECEIKDMDGDGDDDLIIWRERPAPANPTKQFINSIAVLDLLTGAVKSSFSYTSWWPDS